MRSALVEPTIILTAFARVKATLALETRALSKAKADNPSDSSGNPSHYQYPSWDGFTDNYIFLNGATHLVYLTSGTLRSGVFVYNGHGRKMVALDGTITSPYSRGANNNQPGVSLNTLLVLPWIQPQDLDGCCVKSSDSGTVICIMA